MDISNFLGYIRVQWSFASPSNSHLIEWSCQWHTRRRKYNSMAMKQILIFNGTYKDVIVSSAIEQIFSRWQ
jgi:hypothetical protein